MPDVTVFFRDTDKWKSPKEPELSNSEIPLDNSKMLSAEIISDRDVTNLYNLSMCILKIRKRAKDEKRKSTYDNSALEEFMDNFTLMIDEISRKRNIEDFVAHRPGPILEISAPVKYD